MNAPSYLTLFTWIRDPDDTVFAMYARNPSMAAAMFTVQYKKASKRLAKEYGRKEFANPASAKERFCQYAMHIHPRDGIVDNFLRQRFNFLQSGRSKRIR